MRAGDQYIPILSVNDFPMESYPAMLGDLNTAGVGYRWVTRYICTGKESALKAVEKSGRA